MAVLWLIPQICFVVEVAVEAVNLMQRRFEFRHHDDENSAAQQQAFRTLATRGRGSFLLIILQSRTKKDHTHIVRVGAPPLLLL